jgi:hypothetical protein
MKKIYFSPQVPYLYRLHDKKIIKIQDIKISHLGTFKRLYITCRLSGKVVMVLGGSLEVKQYSQST